MVVEHLNKFRAINFVSSGEKNLSGQITQKKQMIL
jgi:hypothetical protein